MSDERRAPDLDPDAPPERAAAAARAARGRLKIFFGAAPGVGTTYAMLDEARRARAAGEDVVVGVAETHGRPEAEALLDGLPAIPRRAAGPRGGRTTELDVDAALARRPARILVDELAHANAPGSKHARRWQDVLELLDAGIDVHTTLGVQHVESLGDVIQQITGVVARETVPDAVIDRADELELVDVSPEELLARLAAGKVCAPEAQRAAPSLFERGNLLALRELALRRIAERVDVDLLAYRKQRGISAAWPAAERILVAVGPSPGSGRLIRATRRMASGLHADWVAAHVEVLGAPLGDKDRERTENHLRLAESLGATVVRLAGLSVAEALLAHARAHNITRIVAGKPTHSRWRDRLRGSLLDELIRGSGTIEVHVIAPIAGGDQGGEAAAAPRAAPGRRERPGAMAYAWALATIAAVTALGLAVFSYATLADITMLYLIAIAIASLRGLGPALAAASMAVAAFDLCFVPPRFTFAVAEDNHVLTFAVMFGAGLAISTLTGRLRRQERDAVIRERDTAALLAFTRDIAAAATPGDVAAVTVRHLEEVFPIAATVAIPDAREPGALVSAAGLMPLSSQELAVVRWAFEHREPAGLGTDTLSGARVLAVPLVAGGAAVGVIAVQARQDPRRRGGAALPLIESFARQAGLALARVRYAAEAREAALRARTEELRSSLLSAVSHDLRTPLSVITGAATTLLRADADRLPAAARAELMATIVDDARRLERILGNLLQLTRVESGLVPSREWIPVEELVGAALTRLEDTLGDRRVELDVPHELVASVDPVLFEQVLINLVENAVKHGAPPIELHAGREGPLVVLELRDHGAGIAASVRPRLFDKLVRAGTAPGAGLGLAVVRAIVEAHGGRVTADSPPGGGARFRIELPADPAIPGAERPTRDALAELPVREAHP